jgi:hypothetical protein
MRYLAEAVDDLDLVDRVDTGRKASVDTEYLVVNDDGERQEIKHVGEVVPYVGIPVFPAAFGIEAVRLGNTAGLVVSADEMYAMGVSKFKANEKRNSFYAEKTAIDIIA